jgi:2-succinyl-6-hydroxy-2,4-cyclohexadiene-1-carboxylate synthase
MPLLDLGPIRLNVEESGTGPALVLLHGFTGCAADWRDHAGVFARRFRVLAVDLLGHGRSDAPNDPNLYRIDRCVDGLALAIDRCGVERASWLGYSMGGRIALALALAHPERVERLVLEGASPGIADPAERRARVASDEALAIRIEGNGVEAFVDEWMKQPLFASQARLGKTRLAQVRAARLTNRAVGLANSLRGAGSGMQEPLWDRLHKIKKPVLLIVGEEDEKFRGIADAMVVRLSDCRIAVIPAAGHNTHLENPEAFRRMVLEFVDRRNNGCGVENR